MPAPESRHGGERRLARREVLAALAATGLAGCGERTDVSDETPSPTPTATTTPSPTATRTPTPTPEPPDVDGWPLPDATTWASRYAPSATLPTERPRVRWRVRYREPEPPGDEYGSYGVAFTGPVTDGEWWYAGREARPSPSSVATEAQFLDAYDADGERQWSVRTPHGPSTPAVVGDLVFVLDGIGLRAFDRRDGTERWGRRRVDSVLPTDEAVFLTAESGLEARSLDGTRRWRRETDGFYVDPAMALGRGDLLVATGYENEANALVAHDPATGRVRWATRALDPDTLCLTGAGLVAVDATERWRVPASEFGERAVGPVVAGDHVLVTEQADDSPGDRLALLTALA